MHGGNLSPKIFQQLRLSILQQRLSKIGDAAWSEEAAGRQRRAQR